MSDAAPLETLPWSAPVEVPSLATLRALREEGLRVGYRGMHIYLRYQALLALLEGQRFRRAVIVGCGRGIFDRLLPPDLELLGLDIAEGEVQTAQGWAAQHRPRWVYLRGTLEEARLPSGFADLVVLSEVLEHVEEAQVGPLLRGVVDLLAPKGRLLVSVPGRNTPRNLARRALGMPHAWMDPTHLREYSRPEAERLLDGLPLSELRRQAALVYLPKERHLGRWFPPEHPLRAALLRAVPGVASHFLLTGLRE